MAALSRVHETSMARDNATNFALQLGVASLQIVLLRCCTCCCDVAACVAATLRCYVWLQCCGATVRVVATLRVADDVRRCSSRGCNTAAL
jgi:hypothetical protein